MNLYQLSPDNQMVIVKVTAFDDATNPCDGMDNDLCSNGS